MAILPWRAAEAGARWLLVRDPSLQRLADAGPGEVFSGGAAVGAARKQDAVDDDSGHPYRRQSTAAVASATISCRASCPPRSGAILSWAAWANWWKTTFSACVSKPNLAAGA